MSILRILSIVFSAALAAATTSTQALPLFNQAGNLVANGNFETGSTTPVTSGSAPSAVSNWSQWANSGPLTSEWSTTHVVEGTHSAHIIGNTNDGLYQYGNYSGVYTLSAWVYVVSGSAHLALASNGGSSAIWSVTSNLLDQWQYISLTANVSNLGGPVIYAASAGSNFYVDGVWLNQGSTSTSPGNAANGFNPNVIASVDEPSSVALLIASILLTLVRRKKRI